MLTYTRAKGTAMQARKQDIIYGGGVTRRYYLRNISWGIFSVIVLFYLYRHDSSDTKTIVQIASVISCFLYPFSKKLIEDIALTFTTREFWSRGFFMETPAKSGGYAVYYIFCFILAIPLGVIFIIYHEIKALKQKRQG